MSYFRNVVLFVGLLMVAGQASAYEYIIFKRLSEDLGIEKLPYKFTVWHIDAAEKIVGPINAKAATIEDKQLQFEYLTAEVERIHKPSLGALVLMGFSAVAKMRVYGLTRTPSAVLLDDDGRVVEMWNGFDHGSELIPTEEGS